MLTLIEVGLSIILAAALSIAAYLGANWMYSRASKQTSAFPPRRLCAKPTNLLTFQVCRPAP